MNYESNRLRTFEEDWLIRHILPEILARYGFYYTGSRDNVRCHFCSIKLGAWEEGDEVITEHLRWSPYCPLMRKQPTQNVPLDPHFLENVPDPTPDVTSYHGGPYELVSNSTRQYDSVPFCRPEYPEYALESERMSVPDPSPDVTSYQSGHVSNSARQYDSVPFCRPEYPEYALESERKRSLAEWPTAMPQKPQQLSDAGFFYTGRGDQVRCYYCGGGLMHWEPDDDPWEQHAMWYSNCMYVRQMKDRSFIERCLAKKEGRNQKEEDVPKTSTSYVSTASRVAETEASDDKLCKICYEKEYRTALIPCGHVTCVDCSLKFDKCPMCQSPIQNLQKLFL
ncbi:hypothetical protein AND_002425 [Anopheles darlingi]|uniref:RING-type domain-containing protein n=1 Tax=Anopheles darlingi TaxID=43151 RepID=W5JN43_ANODA|nr:hypothetical protein AND_002425 [Anopheles darlingi]